MEKDIQIAIARADIILTAIGRALLIIPLAVVLIISVLAARVLLGYDCHMIDYDAPGVDITSEGPANDMDGGGSHAD